MKFDNKATFDGGSYEKPDEGKYMGVLVGFAYCGIQPGGTFGAKPKIMLRWELHKRRGPSKDSKGFFHTVSQTYGATVRGENSLLKKALLAHGIDVAEGATTDSKEWLGHCAWLDIEHSDDGKYANVSGISRLDPQDDEIPARVLTLEHWEPDMDSAPPSWCHWAIARSQDLSHRAPARPAKDAVDDDRSTPIGRPVSRPGVGAAVPIRYADDDIPF